MAREHQDRPDAGDMPPVWRAPRLQRLTGREHIAYGRGTLTDGLDRSTTTFS